MAKKNKDAAAAVSESVTPPAASNAVQAEMPKYKSTKVVRALKIAKVEPTGKIVCEDGKPLPRGATITPADERFAPFDVDAAFVQYHGSMVGGYYVVAANGRKLYVPAAEFEDDYALA
jgi:hypothetical protein